MTARYWLRLKLPVGRRELLLRPVLALIWLSGRLNSEHLGLLAAAPVPGCGVLGDHVEPGFVDILAGLLVRDLALAGGLLLAVLAWLSLAQKWTYIFI